MSFRHVHIEWCHVLIVSFLNSMVLWFFVSLTAILRLLPKVIIQCINFEFAIFKLIGTSFLSRSILSSYTVNNHGIHFYWSPHCFISYFQTIFNISAIYDHIRFTEGNNPIFHYFLCTVYKLLPSSVLFQIHIFLCFIVLYCLSILNKRFWHICFYM
jgi:hypothetical protein